MMGDAFGPRCRLSGQATLRCLVGFAASIAIAGCGQYAGGECFNSKTGERVTVIADDGMWRDAVDSQGFKFAFRNTSKEWRCKERGQ